MCMKEDEENRVGKIQKDITSTKACRLAPPLKKKKMKKKKKRNQLSDQSMPDPNGALVGPDDIDEPSL